MEDENNFKISVICFFINLFIVFYYLSLILFFNYKENIIFEIIAFSNLFTSMMFLVISLISEKLDEYDKKHERKRRYK